MTSAISVKFCTKGFQENLKLVAGFSGRGEGGLFLTVFYYFFFWLHKGLSTANLHCSYPYQDLQQVAKLLRHFHYKTPFLASNARRI